MEVYTLLPRSIKYFILAILGPEVGMTIYYCFMSLRTFWQRLTTRLRKRGGKCKLRGKWNRREPLYDQKLETKPNRCMGSIFHI